MMSLIQYKLFNTDIAEYISHFPCPYFKGVYSSDNIPHFTDNFILVCNLSNFNEIGTHFITLAKLDGELIFFDSLALNWVNNNLKTYINKVAANSISVLNNAIQPIQSHGCGAYCIFFVLFYHAVVLKCIPNDLISFTDTNNITNDDICIKNVDLLSLSLILQNGYRTKGAEL